MATDTTHQGTRNGAGQVDAVLSRIVRDDYGRLLAALIAALRDFDLAEESLAEAMESALIHWSRGLPDNPQGWLLRVARRKAIDRIRKQVRFRDRLPDLEMLALADQSDAAEPPSDIPDERLRLIFTCCHPAIEPKSQVALTLRLLGGMGTADIARAFLDNESTMGQRLTRAKAKIAAARIPFVVPGPEAWAERMGSVQAVIYLIFNAGYTVGPVQDRDLCDEAIFLARMLNELRPADAEVEGFLALVLITHARRSARVDGAGETVALSVQDRTLWDGAAIAEGRVLLRQAMARQQGGPYQIKAAIAACHVADPAPDWQQIAGLYTVLEKLEPTPVITLNRAVALSQTGAVPAALAILCDLAEELDAYQPYHAALADILARNGDRDGALAAYARAIALAASAQDARFLTRRRAALLDV